MGRKRTGWVRQRDGVWYVGLTLRSGKAFEKPIPAPSDTGPADDTYRSVVRAQLVRAYESGSWDPEAPPLPAPDAPPLPAATVPRNPTFIEFLRAYTASRKYESAAKDQGRVEFYLAGSPVAAIHVRELRPAHGASLIAFLTALPSRRGSTLGSSAVRSIYDVCQRALDDAIVEELLLTNPLRLGPVRAQLPPKRFKNAKARKEGWFARDEVGRLLSDPRVEEDRRVLYALLFLTGMRPGESAALRFCDWDRAALPLTRLCVERAIKSVTGVEGPTKTGAEKEAPVHPALETILRAWFETGWARYMGRAPTATDYVVPSVRGRRKGQPRNESTLNRTFRDDCVAIGLRSRHVYTARHTFITQTKKDGGDAALLRLITHAPPSSAYEGYVRDQWEPLCAAVMKLQVDLPSPAKHAEPDTSDGSGETPGPDTLADTLECSAALAANTVEQGESDGSTEESNLPRGAEGTVATSFEDWARHQIRSCFRRPR